MPPTFVSSNFKPYSPPFLYDEVTNEPYLPLPAPHGPRIRITPPRFDDALRTGDSNCHDDLEPTVRHMNDPAVYMWLQAPPFPYTSKDGVTWLEKINKECKGILNEMEGVWNSTPDPNIKHWISGSPVRIIRERQDDGSDVYIGDVGIDRSGFPEILDKQEREQKAKENAAYANGDPRIVWTLGDFMAPSHHGRGIMTAVIRTIIDEWAIPYMGARKFYIGAFSTNIGSQKVFIKNAFSFVGEQANVIDMKKRGKGDGCLSVKWFSRDIPVELHKD